MRKTHYTAMLAGLTLFVFAAALANLTESAKAADWWPFGKADNAKGTAEVVVNEAPLSRETKFTTSFAPVIKKVTPSVVTVTTSKTETLQSNPLFNDPMFRRFFNIPDGSNGQGPKRKSQGLGSGVIVSKDGYILTNNHVIDGVDEIKVTLYAGENESKEVPAKLIGTDRRTDLAVLKVEEANLPSAVLGDSDQIEVGDLALAIGSPFGLGQTVTMGIISAKGRSIDGNDRESYQDFIQTDAAINMGNSGGALIDAEGRLIGINTAIFSRSGGNIGIGFAVPINLARNAMEQIIQNGKVVRGFLGVVIKDVDKDFAEEFNLPEASGVLIDSVEPGSGAQEAKLQAGDVIVSVDGHKMRGSNQLRLYVGTKMPGDKLQVEYIRNGKTATAEVKLGESKETASTEGEKTVPDAQSQEGSKLLSGVELLDLNSSAAAELKLPKTLKGALVVSVTPNSPAAGKLGPGDVIQEVDRKPVANVKETLAAVKALKDSKAMLLVWREDRTRFVILKEEPE
jgi:serine protease Do